MNRIPTDQLFRSNLEPIGDRTIDAILDAAERESLRRGYESAIAEEMLQHPEAAS